jgi:nickel-dependent lactate racemase
MPALGTHRPMSAGELRGMFGTQIPLDAFKEHRWRRDLVALGTVPSEFVHQVSEGALRDSMPHCEIPVQVNRRLLEGEYDATFSIGQVVPHEVAGMANGFKNVLVGAGGRDTINRTHFLGAVYGMERMMGRADTPVRAVLNYAHEHCLKDRGIVYIMTVVARDEAGAMTVRGIYVGDDEEAFLRAAELSRVVNVTLVKEPRQKVVAYLDPDEFKSTWLGNKAIYRTRMAIATGGELIVIAPAVDAFGEDAEIDRLIREYGYRGTPATLDAVGDSAELRGNLSAAAHLIHGSSEGRFRIVYATDPARLSRREVEAVGFEWANVADALRRYPPGELRDGHHEGFYYVGCPALGLWAATDAFEQ